MAGTVAAVTLVAIVPASAAPLIVDYQPRNPAPGDAIDVTGGGCTPGTPVEVIVSLPGRSEPPVHTPGTATADGSFFITTPLPAAAAPNDQVQIKADCDGYNVVVYTRVYDPALLPQPEVMPLTPANGESVDISGGGCTPGVTVIVNMTIGRGGLPVDGDWVSLTADSTGQYSVAMTMFSTASPGDLINIAIDCDPDSELRSALWVGFVGSLPRPTPTPPPTPTPTDEPTDEPTPTPTPTDEPDPTPTSSPSPSPDPGDDPSDEPTDDPSDDPSSTPTATPTSSSPDPSLPPSNTPPSGDLPDTGGLGLGPITFGIAAVIAGFALALTARRRFGPVR
jgi:hypothetical protein